MIRKHFLPAEENDFQPLVLSHRALKFYAAILIVVKLSVTLLVLFYPGYSYVSDITVQTVVNQTNQSRLDSSLGQLNLNSLLSAAAAHKASDMLAQGYFSHTSPSDVTPWYWFNEAGYDYAYAGENLAMDFLTAEDMQEAWMNSSTHRKNILNENYQDVGVAVVNGEYKNVSTTMVVVLFGTQTTPPITLVKTEPEPDPTPEPTPTPEPEPIPEVVTEEELVREELPQVEEEQTVIIPSFQADDSYEVTVTTNDKVEDASLELGGNEAILVQDGDTLTGSIKEDERGVPSNIIKVAMTDSEKNVVRTPLISLDYFKTNILTPDRTFSSDSLAKIVLYSRNFLIAFMIFLVITLILNVLIKVRVQHKPTVVYSLLLVYVAFVLIII